MSPPRTPWTIDGHERDDSQPAQPFPRFGAEKPDHRDDRQESHGGRDHAVAMLVEDAAFHRWHQFSVGERPVGYGKPGVAAGDEPAGNHQQQRTERQQNRPPMETAIITALSCHT